ncbi:hypothetical protein [Streptomyces achromogenes]|uniref:hypothetical protein n=1 Tax=Streptomyces achromogenes TaxID=67255 RepID=UPI0034305C1A
MSTPALLALALLCPAVPAHADATKVAGNVGLSVTGRGLSVQRAGGWMDGHDTGVRARLYTVYKGGRTDLTRWKDATPRTVGIRRFSDVEDWNLRGRRFRNGTWLCIQFNASDSSPCARIHR